MPNDDLKFKTGDLVMVVRDEPHGYPRGLKKGEVWCVIGPTKFNTNVINIKNHLGEVSLGWPNITFVKVPLSPLLKDKDYEEMFI